MGLIRWFMNRVRNTRCPARFYRLNENEAVLCRRCEGHWGKHERVTRW